MKRCYLLIIVLSLGVLLQGCFFSRFLGGDSQEETKKPKMSKKEMRRYVQELEKENESLRMQLESMVRQSQEITDERPTQMDTVGDLEEESASQPTEETLGFESDEEGIDTSQLSIKVLSGNGDINSAKRMARELRKMGYQIKAIDFASKSNFRRDTVFYAPEFEDAAEGLADSLGREMLLKTLNWSSIFDLIVVTGRRR